MEKKKGKEPVQFSHCSYLQSTMSSRCHAPWLLELFMEMKKIFFMR